MSSRRRNISKTSKQLDLEQISHFLKIVGSMSGALLILSIMGYLFTRSNETSSVVFLMIITLNLVVTVCAIFIPNYLLKKKEAFQNATHN